MEVILAIAAGISMALLIILNVMTIVQLFRKRLTIESLVFQTWQVLLLILLIVCLESFGVSSSLYVIAILGMWVFIPQLWSLAKGDESQLHVKVKDNTPSPGPD